MDRRSLLALPAMALLAACTIGVSGKAAPVSQFSLAALPPPSTDYALVVVYRQQMMPLGRKPTVSVNGVDALDLPRASFSWIKVKPGHVHVRSAWAFDTGNLPGFADFDAEAGKVYYFQVTQVFAPPPDLGVFPPPTRVSATVEMAIFVIDSVRIQLQGKNLQPEDEATAVHNLTSNLDACCRYVPTDDDYAPVDYRPPESGDH